MKQLIMVLAVSAVFLFSLSVPVVMAQPIDYCEGNFDNDLDQDGTDAFVFKQDFGRSSLLNPCPVIACQTAEQLEMRIAQLEALLANVTRVIVEGQDTIRFSSMNLQIVDGSGDTAGTVNGLGNLIVGYNEVRPDPEINDRTGSHNIVVGTYQNYVSFGGLVAGGGNTISGPYASISGGGNNIASGYIASVSGGSYNEAEGWYSSVSGGGNNQAMGKYSFVAGGGDEDAVYGNYAVGDYSAILGGRNNTSGDPSRVDTSIGPCSTVSGGIGNTASGDNASVSGGEYNSASGNTSSVSGGGWNTASNVGSSVSGGFSNTASGWGASVSGGNNNIASGYASFVGGGGYNDPIGGNYAVGNYSAILGGIANTAGDPNRVDPEIGQFSSVSGGEMNTASGTAASVSGGYSNTASGLETSVSGGAFRSATSQNNWAAGSLWQNN